MIRSNKLLAVAKVDGRFEGARTDIVNSGVEDGDGCSSSLQQG